MPIEASERVINVAKRVGLVVGGFVTVPSGEINPMMLLQAVTDGFVVSTTIAGLVPDLTVTRDALLATRAITNIYTYGARYMYNHAAQIEGFLDGVVEKIKRK